MLIVERLLPGIKAKNTWLVIASIVFYAFGQLVYLPLFLGSVALNYGMGLLLQGQFCHRKAVVTIAAALNLAVLGAFKYTDFIIANLNAFLGLSIPLPGIELPIGISFFTFQGMSYVFDVYRDRDSGSRSFGKVLLYISLFPQLIAGPIVKYHDIAQQIDSRSATAEDRAEGVSRFIVGLSKKLLLANSVGLIADRVFNNFLPAGGLDWRLAWLGAICYTLQIYLDFSAYSDMAIGLGRMFGFTIKENFNYPYTSLTMRDFWRRWHISLSTWFREYLYIPLGGSRRGRGRTLFNRMAVFLCTGIWHGANWTFLLWGLIHGALTCLEDVGLIPTERLKKSFPGRALLRVYTLLSVTLLFVLFRADNLSAAWGMFAAMFAGRATAYGTYLLRSLLTPAACLWLFISVLASSGLAIKAKALGSRLPGGVHLERAACLGLLALSVLNLSANGFNPFIYFQF